MLSSRVRSAPLVVLALLGVVLAAPLGATPAQANELEKLKETLEDDRYAAYWDKLDAMRRLGNIGTPDAAALLVTMLADDDGAIREAAVNGLARLKSEDAIRVVVQRGLGDPRNAQVRAHAAWALRLIGSEATAADLARILERDRDPSVRIQAARALAALGVGDGAPRQALLRVLGSSRGEVKGEVARALGELGVDEAWGRLERQVRDRDADAAVGAIDAAALLRPSEAPALIERAFSHRDVKVRIAAMEGTAEADPTQGLALASRGLEDREWQVRAAAIAVLGGIREKEAVDALIGRLEEEDGRLLLDAMLHLRRLTGQQIDYFPQDWIGWWEINRDTFELPPEEPSERAAAETRSSTITSFYGIPIFSKRLSFVLDYSGSMWRGSPSKLDIARQNLEATIRDVARQTGVRFNIVVISSEANNFDVRRAAPTLVPANPQSLSAGLTFFDHAKEQLSRTNRGRGDHWNGVMDAMADPDVDTLFLLSDGRPTYGDFHSPEGFLEEFERVNRFRRIHVHTILIGAQRVDASFMESLADLSGGLFVNPPDPN